MKPPTRWSRQGTSRWLSTHLATWSCPFNGSVFLFFVLVIKPENPYFVSRSGLEVNPLGVYPLGPRSSSSGPTKGIPPPGDSACVALFYYTDIGESLQSRGFITSEPGQGGHIHDPRSPTSPLTLSPLK